MLGIAVAAGVVAVVGVIVAIVGLAGGSPARSGATVTPTWVTSTMPSQRAAAGVQPLARSVPVSIRIPAIGVSAPVMLLGKNADDTVQVPPLSNPNLTGWYKYGASPGQRGTAVILGHVDTVNGLSVFYYLRDLRVGDKVYITLTDGKVAVFAVDGLQEVAKTAFPTEAVYGPDNSPVLRLITCGGAFDETTGHYLDSIIVYAHLI
jgi:LPXTG-site transpeptidase (sortase) family protein